MGVRPFFWMLVCLLPAGEGLAQTDARERVVESIVPMAGLQFVVKNAGVIAAGRYIRRTFGQGLAPERAGPRPTSMTKDVAVAARRLDLPIAAVLRAWAAVSESRNPRQRRRNPSRHNSLSG
jgi:hypothetical protein